MDDISQQQDNVDKGPWFPLGMKPEERRIVRNLVLAAKNGEEEEVKEILQSGKVNVDSKYHWETALMVAARNNNVALCEILLDHGANCNVSRIMQQTALWIAASHGNLEAMEMLLATRKCSQENLDNSLRKCIIMNFLHGCDSLLRAGADVDATDSMGYTALHMAAGNTEDKVLPRQDSWKFQNLENWRLYHANNYEVCELLIMWKANVNAQDNEQSTPLHFACEAGSDEICRLLLENGANVNAIGGNGARTPLHVAVSKDYTKIVKMFLHEEKIQLNIKDSEGDTPLMSAIQLHKKECVRILLADDRWVELMSVVTRREQDDNEMIDTPMRILIRQMPDMACLVMNKCIELRSHKDPKNPDFTARFNFAFLDDTYTSCHWSESNTDTMTTIFGENRNNQPRHSMTPTPVPTIGRKSLGLLKPPNVKGKFRRKDTVVGAGRPVTHTFSSVPPCDPRCFSCMGPVGVCRLNKHSKPYTKSKRILMNNHPLKIAHQEKCYSVLCHPVAIALINYKWKNVGRYSFYGGLLMYFIFVGLLTSHVMIAFYYTNSTTATIANTTTRGSISPEFYQVWRPSASIVLMGLCAIAVIKFIFNMVTEFPGFIWKISHWLDLLVYVTAIVVIIEIMTFNFRHEFQELAATCIFTAWFNMLLTLRQFPVVGIFFLMFTRILKNSVIVLLIFTPLMAAFAFTCSIILPTLRQFHSDMTFSTILIMLSGEVEFVDTLTGTGSSSIRFRGAAIAIYVLFTILMVIGLLNLLVGLAVSDVETLHNQAKAEMMSMKAEKVIACEYYLSDIPRKRVACGCFKYQPNKARFSFSKHQRKLKLKERFIAWFNVFQSNDSELSPYYLTKLLTAERSESAIETLSREVSQLKLQLDTNVLLSPRKVKKESIALQPMEFPGARKLRKAHGIDGTPQSSTKGKPSDETDPELK